MPPKEIDWSKIVPQLIDGRVTPIISNRLVHRAVFGKALCASLFDTDDVIELWAQEIKYPFTDSSNLLTRAAQYLNIKGKTPTAAQDSYLRFLKKKLIKLAEEGGRGQSREGIVHEGNSSSAAQFPPDVLDHINRDLENLGFSELASDWLLCPDFQDTGDCPLLLLARLPIKVYVTTSHYRLLEAALKAQKKTPHTQVYCWCAALHSEIPSEHAVDPDFAPNVNSPLVYHLHGLDKYPNTLVLSEIDHLDFLLTVCQDAQERPGKPSPVSAVLREIRRSCVVLLGYELHGWELRSLWKGLLKDVKPGRTRQRGYAIQLDPSELPNVKQETEFRESFEAYLERYFDEAHIDVYYKDTETFIQEMWDAYNARRPRG